MAPAAETKPENRDWNAALALVLGLTLVRLFAIFRTPLNLYPDEAQYWLWSRTLDFGYFSKPPMIAWTIWATTQIGGDSEAWVRLSAPLFQAGAALVVFAIGRRLYGPRAGLAGAALYSLAPAVQLSAAVMATDAPLLFFTGLALLAYVGLQSADGSRRLWLAAAFGIALGLAFLSKYAALYALIGLALHLTIAREARRAWSPSAAMAALAAFAVTVAPNLIWNATHGFATVQHTASNADWSASDLFNPVELAEFVLSQIVIFGPIPAIALIVGGVIAARRRNLQPGDTLLLCFILPPIAIVSAEAFISRANANWAALAYLPAAVLAGAWLTRWRARRWLTAAIVIQAAVALLFLTCTISPRTAETLGLANSFKRAKGWDQMAKVVVQRTEDEHGAGLSAVAVNNRFLYYALAYYGRDYFGQPWAPPLKAWMLTGRPENQAETTAPLTAADGRRVLAVAYEGWNVPEMTADFAQTSDRQISRVRLDRKRSRRMDLFIGEGFRPGPRDPETGEPILSDSRRP